MARRASVENTTTSVRTDVGSHVIPVPVGATPLVTVGPDDEVWQELAASGSSIVDPASFAGAFVRVIPPLDVDSALVRLLESAIVVMGAVAVKIVPRARTSIVAHAVVAAQEGTSIRDVVGRLMNECVSGDREALRALGEEIMAEAGL